MPGRWPRPVGGIDDFSTFVRTLIAAERKRSAKPMKKKIELDEETTRMLDEVRGDFPAQNMWTGS
jgi:hypothetical protein